MPIGRRLAVHFAAIVIAAFFVLPTLQPLRGEGQPTGDGAGMSLRPPVYSLLQENRRLVEPDRPRPRQGHLFAEPPTGRAEAARALLMSVLLVALSWPIPILRRLRPLGSQAPPTCPVGY